MRTTRWLALGTLAAALALGTLATAQPRPGHWPARPSAPKPKPSAGASDNPYDDKAPAAPAASAAPPSPPPPTAPSTAAAAVPAPPPAAAPDGGKLSPLNPAPAEFSDAGPPVLTVDYDRLLADIGALRARVAAVSDTLFHSRIAISLQTSGDHGRVASVNVSLDDGVVWTSPPGFRAEDATTIYDHAVAPGHHAVTVDVERRDDRNDAFRSTQRSRFVVEVPADQRLGVELKLWDDSNMGEFAADRKGSYELRVRMRAKAQPMQPAGK